MYIYIIYIYIKFLKYCKKHFHVFFFKIKYKKPRELFTVFVT